jgi:putative ABC transport system permease protein
MFRHYWISAWRSLRRYLSVTVMNVTGLTAGLACTFLIFLWVGDELKYDRFHMNAEQIYRVEEDQPYSNGTFHVTVTPWPSGPVWKLQIPEIQEQCRLTAPGSFLIARNEVAFYEEGVLAVDSSFFRLFSFPLLRGDAGTVLGRPLSMVISDEMAAKYFGKEDPMGKTLLINTREVFQVTGVFRKMPENSSVRADFLIPYDYMKHSQYYSESWSSNSIETYVKLIPGADTAKVNRLLTRVVAENNTDNTTRFMVFPLVKQHLYSYFGFGHKPGAILNVWIFSAIALLVLLIACINFMNLSTAQSAMRAKEIALRKVNGATRRQLMTQFFGESALTTLIAAVVAVVLCLVLMHVFNRISGKHFVAADLMQPVFVAGLVVISVLTALSSGLYPALVLSGFKPVSMLKGGQPSGMTGTRFRKISVFIQFALSIMLITGTLVLYKQLQYMQSKKLGYDKENLLYIPLRGDLKKSYDLIKQELLQEPGVKAISASNSPPYMIGSNSDNITWEGKPADMHVLVSMGSADYDYIEAMGIKLKAGRGFSSAFPGDADHDTTANFIINEQLEKIMETDNAVGARLKFGSAGTVIGVMKDFNFQSLHEPVAPLALAIWGNDYRNFMLVRLQPGNLAGNLKLLGKAWERVVPAYPMDFHFVDQEIEGNYRSEIRMGTLMNIFSLLALIIGSIGLFGLSAYMVEKKNREVGLRKALGAGNAHIIFLFLREFLVLQFVAALIVIPVSYRVLQQFLNNYNYRISLNPWLFAASVGITLVVAVAAISYQTLKALRINPAITLKQQ